MRRVIDEFIDPADHLALDESLLMSAEEGTAGPALRLWEFARPTVVLGRSSRIADEVDAGFCAARGIPVLRRCSGGASVVGGPGCLMYSVVLELAGDAELRKIDVAHRHVMRLVRDTIRRQVPEVRHQGICDLTWRDRKCSGNSLKVARNHLLYHGTVLYRFDLSLIGRCLAMAPRQPDYRRQREHSAFVTNVPIDPARFAEDLCDRFGVRGQQASASYAARIRQLRLERYDSADWHERH